MRDELVIEEMTVRAIQEKMDEAFRAAMQRAIDIGEERRRALSRRSRALRIRRSCSLSEHQAACSESA
jgi:hypothetical protein